MRLLTSLLVNTPREYAQGQSNDIDRTMSSATWYSFSVSP